MPVITQSTNVVDTSAEALTVCIDEPTTCGARVRHVLMARAVLIHPLSERRLCVADLRQSAHVSGRWNLKNNNKILGLIF